jgi:hypothetical protein
MTVFVHGTVPGTRGPYRDGLEPLEIWVPRKQADGLPYVLGQPVPIKLRIADARYDTELRSTPRNPCVWISPRLFSQNGERRKLAHVLDEAEFVKKEKVLLRVNGTAITVLKLSTDPAQVDRGMVRNGGLDEKTFLEGEKRAMKGTVRSPQLRAAAKKKWGLKCYCCGFDFEVFYGSVAKGLAIVHHLELFQRTSGKRRSATVEDVRVVCANCHHVLHVENPPINIDELKSQILQSWSSWSEKGVRPKK